MAKTTKENRIMTIALIAILIVAGIAVVYVSMTGEEKKDNKKDGKTLQDQNDTVNMSAYFTVEYQGNITQYNLTSIENFDEITGSGLYQSKKGLQNGTNYTGIKLISILNEIQNLSENYSVNITASDGWFQIFNSTMVSGDMPMEDNCTNCTVTMLIAYKKDGSYLSEDEGPFRVVFIDGDAVTSSKYWIQNVVSIKITEE